MLTHTSLFQTGENLKHRKPKEGFNPSTLLTLHKCVSAACIHPSILHHLSPTWPQRSCVNTRPQHALFHQSACQRGRGMDPTHVPVPDKGRRRVSRETWKGEGRTEEGTDVHLKGRARGQITVKVEWDIWKREGPRHRQEIAAAQKWFIGENFSSTSLCPLFCLPATIPNALPSLHTLLLIL